LPLMTIECQIDAIPAHFPGIPLLQPMLPMNCKWQKIQKLNKRIDQLLLLRLRESIKYHRVSWNNNNNFIFTKFL